MIQIKNRVTGEVIWECGDLTSGLRNSRLEGADLRGIDLRDADLSGAQLCGASLEDVNLTGACLRYANLNNVNLRAANLETIRVDFEAVLSAASNEVADLRRALTEGKVDGSTYLGPCCCLAGTIAKSAGCTILNIPGIDPNVDRPAERWFLAIKPGDTPENSQIVAITVEWIDAWFARRRDGVLQQLTSSLTNADQLVLDEFLKSFKEDIIADLVQQFGGWVNLRMYPQVRDVLRRMIQAWRAGRGM